MKGTWLLAPLLLVLQAALLAHDDPTQRTWRGVAVDLGSTVALPDAVARTDRALAEFERGWAAGRRALGLAVPEAESAPEGLASILLHARPADRVVNPGRGRPSDTRPARVVPSSAGLLVHCVIGPGWEHVAAMAGARLALYQHGGRWSPALAEGFALSIAGRWEGRAERPARAWLPVLVGHRDTSLDELLLPARATDGEPRQLASRYLLSPWADALVTRVRTEPALWSRWLADPMAADAALRKDLETVLASTREEAKRVAATLELPPRRPLPETVIAGYCFAHEGYRVVDGYGSRLANESLAAAHESGARAVALTPFLVQRRKDAGTPTTVGRGAWMPADRYRGGGETDEAVTQSALDARALGLRVVMKPHVWIPRSWPGDVLVGDDEVEAWFAVYSEYALHWAMWSELHEVDVFIVATEFSRMVKTYPDRWRALFRKVRAIHRGPNVFGANWDDPLRDIAVNDLVDAIGLSLYPPMTSDPAASDEALRRSAREICAELRNIARDTGKPIFVCEVGYPTREAAWLEPHREGGRDEAGMKAQQRAFDAMLPALEQTPGIAGVLVWKWPSHLSYRETRRATFTPSGAPSEAFVGASLKRLSARAVGMEDVGR